MQADLALWLKRTETGLKGISTVLSAWFLLVCALVIILRIGYHYDLEWMEGASLIQVQRLLNGQGLYVKPTMEYIPMLYTPLYYYFSALLARMTGLSFLPLRLVSALSSLGCFLLIYQFVRERTGSKQTGMIACGLFAASFVAGGAWFDIARVDMLYLFFCLAGMVFYARQPPFGPLLAGMMLALAFLTKQNALFIFCVFFVYGILFERRKVTALAAAFILPLAIIVLVLNYNTRGWFNYYVFGLPSTHTLVMKYIPEVLILVFVPMFLAFLLGSSALFLNFRQAVQDKLYRYTLFLTFGFLAGSILGYINKGSYKNVMVPAFAMLALFATCGFEKFKNILGTAQKSKGDLLRVVLWLGMVMQFGLLLYNPLTFIPTKTDQLAGDTLVAGLSATPGEVLIPYHNYLAWYAGKTVYYHQIALEELRGSFSSHPALEWDNIYTEIITRDLEAIYLDDPALLLNRNTCLTSETIRYTPADAFFPVTGGQTRPEVIFKPCQ